MNIDAIQDSFKDAIAGSVRLRPEGANRYQVFTPCHFDDGDHFVIALEKANGGGWALTDDGHTYMHMSYHTKISSLESGTRNVLIESALKKHGVEESGGQILAHIDNLDNAGNVFYNYIQCLIKITDVAYLNRERVASMFMEDFQRFIGKALPRERVKLNYHDESHDPAGKYKVDCRVNGMSRPEHVYAINNDDKCRDTTISILTFKSWEVPCRTLGVFENQKKMNRKVVSRLKDVCDYTFPKWEENREKIAEYLQERMDNGR